mmetsp:Transcript_29144/g.46202  ORF Transcript_29144/g.46202 Transcript_29144/m.46202 type:complete len:273 (+) Transcript_29144:287-1105(+)
MHSYGTKYSLSYPADSGRNCMPDCLYSFPYPSCLQFRTRSISPNVSHSTPLGRVCSLRFVLPLVCSLYYPPPSVDRTIVDVAMIPALCDTLLWLIRRSTSTRRHNKTAMQTLVSLACEHSTRSLWHTFHHTFDSVFVVLVVLSVLVVANGLLASRLILHHALSSAVVAYHRCLLWPLPSNPQQVQPAQRLQPMHRAWFALFCLLNLVLIPVRCSLLAPFSEQSCAALCVRRHRAVVPRWRRCAMAVVVWWRQQWPRESFAAPIVLAHRVRTL